MTVETPPPPPLWAACRNFRFALEAIHVNPREIQVLVPSDQWIEIATEAKVPVELHSISKTILYNGIRFVRAD